MTTLCQLCLHTASETC